MFRDQLQTAPAKFELFHLELKDNTEWYISPKRPDCKHKQNNMRWISFLEKAISNNIIRPSQTTAWSQLLLTPKPKGKWRVCMDFRSLNTQTKSMGWPIPNIKDMINKIGSKRAKMVWCARSYLRLSPSTHRWKIETLNGLSHG